MAEKTKVKKFAIIKTGGKQYKISEGDTLLVEKLDAEEGKTLDIKDILLVADGDKVEVGKPIIENGNVRVKIISQEKADKIVVLKYKKRKNYRKKTGHRQKLTKVQVEKISVK